MMISAVNVLLPTILLTVFALLSIPVFRFIRGKPRFSTVLSVLWLATIFVCVGISVADLSLRYFGQQQAFLTVALAGSNVPVSSSFLVDAVSVYMSQIIVIVSIVLCLFAVFHLGSEERLNPRYYALLLIVVGSVLGAVFSGDLLTLFIFWEASAVGSCFLIAYRRNRVSSGATLKYLVMIIIASSFIIYGLSLVYALTGSLNFWTVKAALAGLENKGLLVVAAVFLASGYAIESAIVPFHMWLPDAYTAAPASSSAFLSAVVDQASYYVLLRVLVYILTPTTALNWTLMLGVLSALTMVVGNLLALSQRNIKRLIANVCIADVGYNLIAITSFTPLGLAGNLYFFLTGGITTALAFMVVGVFNSLGVNSLEDLSGYGRKMPFTSFALFISAFSFSGIPPFAGFIAKFTVFTAAIEGGMAWLAVIGVVMSALQTAYFLRLINHMYAKPSQDTERIKEPRKQLVPIYILLAAIFVLGLYPSIVFNQLGPAVEQIKLLMP
jgi:proton-translocating NADH-quinone oxidoreductase chain N